MDDEELLPPPGMSGTAAIRALADALTPDALTLAETRFAETVRVYLDTFDGRLGAAGLAAVHTRDQPGSPSGRLAVVDAATGAEQAGQPWPTGDGPLLAVELEPGPARAALLPIVDVRALLALAELDVQATAFAVRDDLGKTVARIALEHARMRATGEALAARLRLQGVRGYDRETARIAGRARELGFTVARRPLVEDAVVADGGSPGGTSSKVGVELLANQRSDAAAAAVLRRLLEVIEANLDGSIADLDAEFLHDLRVAVRRSRAVLRELKTVFPPRELGHFRAELKWLQGITGPARDHDVYVLEFDAMRELVPAGIRDDLDPVMRVLKDRRELAHRTMVRELRSERMMRLRREWDAFLEELVAAPLDERPQAQQAIGELAGMRIAKVYRRIRKMGRAIGPDSPAEEYHEIRKKGKELRYLLELFGTPLFGAETVKPMIKSLKSLQDVLGRHQDREVQQATLRGIAEQVSGMPGRTAALMAMGVLLEHLGQDEIATRGEFAEQFAEFTSKERRAQVKDVFA
ncbi:MAG TPA: CHAD domain-containing protein [Solirubrobacteraceae bacterium]|nr:CHAD domain-containing protein [Solirubrobacteraceae bacterium]